MTSKKRSQILISRERFSSFKEELRSLKIEYRDCGDTIIVPRYQESFIVEDTSQDNMSPGLAAYVELRRKIDAKQIYRWGRQDLRQLEMRPPQLFTGPRGPGWLGYIDIKSAYFQLYQHLFWNMRWPRKDPALPLLGLFDALAGWKEARNCIVGIARSQYEKWVNGNEVTHKPKINRYLSPALWWSLQSILSEIAQTMIDRFGCIYSCVDSYVFGDQVKFDQAALWFMDHNIDVRTHQSPKGEIFGWCSMRIGKKQTKLQERSTKFIYHLEETDGRWIDWWLKNKEKNSQ